MTNHRSKATVFTRPGCMKCRVTHKRLTALGVPVVLEQIDDHPEKITFMQSQGWMELPLVEVVIDGETHTWSGMSQDNLDAVKYLVGRPS